MNCKECKFYECRFRLPDKGANYYQDGIKIVDSSYHKPCENIELFREKLFEIINSKELNNALDIMIDKRMDKIGTPIDIYAKLRYVRDIYGDIGMKYTDNYCKYQIDLHEYVYKAENAYKYGDRISKSIFDY